MTLLIATSTHDFDPTEIGVPWKIFHDAGHEISVATDSGKSDKCDQRMLTGEGIGFLKPMLIAHKNAQVAYEEMCDAPAYLQPLSYDEIDVEDFDGLLLPGGHAKGIIPYLESTVLLNHIVNFSEADKPVGAICHGVVAACRAQNLKTGKFILYGCKTTALLKRQEMLAYQLTRLNLGDYYRTNLVTIEDEVIAALEN